MDGLSTIRQLLEKNQLGESDVVSLMINIRVVMERTGTQRSFRWLNLYCNWVGHPIISSSTAGFEILEEMTGLLLNYADEDSARSDPSLQALFGRLMQVCESRLKSDFEGFCVANNLPTDISQDPFRWMTFFGSLANTLVERPLSLKNLSNPKSQQLRALKSIQRIANGKNVAVHSFRFLLHPRLSHPERLEIHWEMEVAWADGTGYRRFIGPLLLFQE